MAAALAAWGTRGVLMRGLPQLRASIVSVSSCRRTLGSQWARQEPSARLLSSTTPFLSSSPPSSSSRAEAVAFVQQVAEHVLDSFVFVGTRQYDDATPAEAAESSEAEEPAESAASKSNFVLCALGPSLTDPYEPFQLGVAELDAGCGADELHAALLDAGALGVVHGEVDALGWTDWSFGFFHETTFTLFSAQQGPVCMFFVDQGNAVVRLWQGMGSTDVDDGTPQDDDGAGDMEAAPQYRVIPVKAITSVCLRVGQQPWHDRELFFRLADSKEEVTILRDTSGGLTEAEDHDPLLGLMVETSWLVKAAGSLTLAIRRTGGAAQLLLPRDLLASHNPWVNQRNLAWQQLFANSNAGRSNV